VGSSETAVVLAGRDRDRIADLLPAHYSALTLGRPAELAPSPSV
jgi:hypothetical protein